MIPDSVREEILERVNILELISQYVELKKSGKNYMGLCPFHHEKTPSFSVSEEKGLFHCFGCGASGNSIGFIMKIHNFDFVEALEFLGEKYGIEIRKEEVKGRKEFLSINEFIVKEAKKALFSSKNKIALDYLLGRNFDTDTVDEFDIGYIPEDFDINCLLRNFSKNELFDSGNFFNKQGNFRLRFEGRLIIPIKNESGKVVGFSGRSLDGTMPKYVNSPESKFFKKRELLYNLNLAKQYIKEKNQSIIVEGFFDVIRLYKHGFKNVVSPMGTSFTKEQTAILKRFSDEGVIIFDGDEAGINASFRAIDNCIASNFFPNVVFLPRGEDPDSMLNKNEDEFKKLLQKKKDILIFLFTQMYKKSTTNNQKRQNLMDLYKKIQKINDPYNRNHYEEQLAKVFNIDKNILDAEVKSKTLFKKQSDHKNTNMSYICEEEFITSLFNLSEDIIDNLVSDITEEMFANQKNRIIFKKVVEILHKDGNIAVLFNDIEHGETLANMTARVDSNTDSYKNALINKYKIINNFLDRERKRLINHISTNKLNEEESIKILKNIQDILARQKHINAKLSEV
ncbi:DNA primase [Deferribacterales bacterium Es71-Z0220]|uniref:DNA primase n=1 Tax=Deferrivibrio essentukiensis TaxID=2880922 RepID=UPI001F60C09C|nr:DNA primase [Deferrivibrio essentukiensis]MCB4205156.1 DNA primase [Deferrivibrio essentukiensis]